MLDLTDVECGSLLVTLSSLVRAVQSAGPHGCGVLWPSRNTV